MPGFLAGSTLPRTLCWKADTGCDGISRSGVACLLTGLGTVGTFSCHSVDRKGQFDHANTTVAQEISPLVE